VSRPTAIPASGFFERLARRAVAVDSLLCVGLDPHPELLSHPTAEAARDLCLRLIDATAEHACALKPNSAFFERFGEAGWAVLHEVVAAVPPEIPVILDAKRGDIASTAEAYAAAVFEDLRAGAVTLNPYLGRDAVEPFLNYPGRGVFLLCKTSNPSANEFQGLSVGERPLYLEVARQAQRWAGPETLGLVVGATDVEALVAVRAQDPEVWLLAPGVGLQGAELEPALQAGLRADGLGMLLPVARAIAAAEDPGQEAGRLRGAINAVRETVLRGAKGGSGPKKRGRRVRSTADSFRRADRPSELTGERGLLADALLEFGCVRFGEFTLKSGVVSPIYFDLRRLTGRPELLDRTAQAYLPLLGGLRFDRLAAVPYAGLPIGIALALHTGKPLIYPRKERKGYGTGAAVEGGFEPGETVLLIDDLATTGGSKLEALEALRAEGLRVTDVVVLIDREGGAGEELARAGCRLDAVFTLAQLLDHWQRDEAVPVDRIEAVRAFMASPSRTASRALRQGQDRETGG
jgi:uridine monophosphate synthetase